MRSGLRGYPDSLGGRLLLRLVIALVALLSLYLLISLSVSRGRWQDLTYHHAQSTSQLIERATRYGMLLNRKEDVHETIQRIAETPEVASVRIFDKNGLVIFAADESEIGTRVDLQAEACLVCHEAPGATPRQIPDPPVREFRRADGVLALGLINPIRNAPECSNAACHAHPAEQQVLGVLDVQMSLGMAERALSNLSEQAFALTVLMGTVLAAVAAVFVHQLIRTPILELNRGMEQVASGNLETRVLADGKGELGGLARSFNRMAEDLHRAREELTDWSRTLEHRVLEKTRELHRTQQQIIQAEKMVSLGRLAATVAHELNNPLSGILTYAKLVDRTLAEGELSADETEELCHYLDLIQQESARCGQIVRNLLTFARRTTTEFGPANLNQILDRSLTLVRHSIELSEIDLEVEPLEGHDEIECDANQLQQALLAIFINAVESMPSGGQLRVAATGDEDRVKVMVGDTGVGISPDQLSNIFEPFFSTKEERFGVGLGLSVVYGIVRRHGGKIDVQSEPNAGTTVLLELPRRPPTPEHTEGRQDAKLELAGMPNTTEET